VIEYKDENGVTRTVTGNIDEWSYPSFEATAGSQLYIKATPAQPLLATVTVELYLNGELNRSDTSPNTAGGYAEIDVVLWLDTEGNYHFE